MLRRRLILAALAAATLAGCGPTREEIEARRGVDAYLSGNFPTAKRVLEPLTDKTDENYVLNNLRFGATALASHDYDEAERAYVKAYQIMNATKVNDAGREAAAVWLNESSKVWRGEPYERAVANLQLGMIYYSRGDYDNARGAFENALFKLRDYRNPKDKSSNYDEQESDFAVALLMLGRTWLQLGRDDQAQPYFSRAAQMRPNLAGLANQLADRSNNVLLYVEFGFGPRKVEDGMDGAALSFVPKPFQAGAIPSPRVIVDGRNVQLDDVDRPLFDTLLMATDRRWQKIDTIRQTKSLIGTGLLVAGAGTAIYGADRRDEGIVAAGLGAAAVGALLKASSHVDTRVWEMTPRTAFVLPLKLSPGTHDVTIAFASGIHQTWRGLVVPTQGTPDENGNSNGEATYLFRMLRWTSGEYTWPAGERSTLATVEAAH